MDILRGDVERAMVGQLYPLVGHRSLRESLMYHVSSLGLWSVFRVERKR